MVQARELSHLTQSTVWCFSTVGTRCNSAPWRIRYVLVTASGLWIHFRTLRLNHKVLDSQLRFIKN